MFSGVLPAVDVPVAFLHKGCGVLRMLAEHKGVPDVETAVCLQAAAFGKCPGTALVRTTQGRVLVMGAAVYFQGTALYEFFCAARVGAGKRPLACMLAHVPCQVIALAEALLAVGPCAGKGLDAGMAVQVSCKGTVSGKGAGTALMRTGQCSFCRLLHQVPFDVASVGKAFCAALPGAGKATVLCMCVQVSLQVIGIVKVLVAVFPWAGKEAGSVVAVSGQVLVQAAALDEALLAVFEGAGEGLFRDRCRCFLRRH